MSKICKYCGKGYESNTKQKRYCSPLCKGRSQYQRLTGIRILIRPIQIKCKECGEEFKRNKGSSAIYCSMKCKRKKQRRRYKERYPDKVKAQKHWDYKLREKVGKACIICGFIFLIEYHHINGTECNKIIPLCPNHHRMIHRFNLTPSEVKILYQGDKANPIEFAQINKKIKK